MNKIINKTLFTEQLRRFWAVGVLTLIAFVLGIYLPFYQNILRGEIFRAINSINQIIHLQQFFLMFLMLVVPFTCVLALFHYANKGASTSAFHCFPVNKKQIFFSNVAAGWVLMLVPLLILSFLLLMTPVRERVYDFSTGYQIFVGTEVINSFFRVTVFFLRAALGFTFYFAVFTFAASVSGSRIVGGLLGLTLPLIPIGLLSLVMGAGSLYLFGLDFANSAIEEIIYFTGIFTNPVVWGSAGFRGVPGIVVVFVYFAICAVVMALAYMCYHRRKQERAGDSIVFTPVKNVLVFLLSIAGMVSIGVSIMYLAGARWWLYPGFAVGFVISFFIAQMIAEKTFMVAYKAKSLLRFGLVLICMYAVLIFVTHVAMRGIVNFIPEQNDVVGVNFRNSWNLITTPETFASDPYAIAATIDIHNQILAHRQRINNFAWNNELGRNRQPSFRININYLLANGRIVQRSYTLPRSLAQSFGAYTIMDNPSVILSNYPALISPGVIDEIIVRFDHYATDERIIRSFSPNNTAQFQEIINAIKYDVVNNRSTTWRNEVSVSIVLHRDYQHSHNNWGIGLNRYSRLYKLLMGL